MKVENYRCNAENASDGLSEEQIKSCLIESVKNRKLSKVLLIPPDITRKNSGAGLIVSLYYQILKDVQVDILPALGTHAPMTREEQVFFFGSEIPQECYLEHDWRNNITKVGEVPGEYVSDVSDGLINQSMNVELSNYLLDPAYDLILSIGQVVPHEVAGMANYTKNIVIGCGGSDFINRSHMLGAVCGMEQAMGNTDTPVRKVFDYAQAHYIDKLPVEYVLTVTVSEGDKTDVLGLYIGKERKWFEQAAKLSRTHNLIKMDSPIKTCVVMLDEHEFRSTWLGNKAIYRTRMAMADGGRLIILAPGITRFGEDDEIDRLIRKFGYIGRDNVLRLCETEPELKNNLSAAAHLIHGSTDGRFNVVYATDKLSKEDVENAGFEHMPLSEALDKYNPDSLTSGYNKTEDNEEIFYIENPALGLWTVE